MASPSISPAAFLNLSAVLGALKFNKEERRSDMLERFNTG
jgi:hypothetical protein